MSGGAAAKAALLLRRQQWWQRGPISDKVPVQPELVAIALGAQLGVQLAADGCIERRPLLAGARAARLEPPRPPACALQSTWCRACWACPAWRSSSSSRTT